MKRAILAMLLIGLGVGCQRVPLSGRNQLLLIPSSQLLPLSFTNYRQVLDTSRVVRSGDQAEMSKRVGARIQRGVEQYLRANNQSQRLNGFQWEFNLIQSPQVNAWCMPGGKVAFYTGILPICRDEAGVATVMGHEISHAIAEHGNERMSRGLLAQLGLTAGQVALGAYLNDRPRETQALFMNAYGIGAPVGYQLFGELPHSRKQELESDQLGLIFMALAGYNPQEAVGFWQRMAKAGGGRKPPEFVSTHPSDDRRIKDIQRQLPEAMKYYKR